MKLRKFNSLWSNIQTLKPMVFSRAPKPIVERRYMDRDPAARLACTVLERVLSFQIETSKMYDHVSMSVDDYLLPGMGVTWVRYDPSFESEEAEEENEEVTPSPKDPNYADDIAEDGDGSTYEKLAYETLCVDHVFYKDFRWGPARTWPEVPWVDRVHYFTKSEAEEKWGEEKAKQLILDYTPPKMGNTSDDDKTVSYFKKAEIHEIWNKADRKVYWIPIGSPVTSAATLFTQDMIGYESVSVQVTSAGSTCTITYETSDDNTNWVSTSGLISTQIGATALTTTSTAVGLFTFPKRGRYFRARVSTYGSGTVTVVGNLHKNPISMPGRLTMDGPSTFNTGLAAGITPYLQARSANVVVGANAVVQAISTLNGVQITKPYSVPELDWQYAAASGGIVDTADNVLVAAGAAGIRNYLTRLDLINTDATVGTEVVVKDGSTVIWRTFAPASTAAVTQPMPMCFTFPTPLKGTAATALNVACITTSSQTYVNAGGYQAA